jgi:hypothetical protein
VNVSKVVSDAFRIWFLFKYHLIHFSIKCE